LGIGVGMNGRSNYQQRRRLLSRVAALIGAAVFLVLNCLPAAKAQVGSGAATITTMSGQVSIERDGEQWAVSAGQAIESGQVLVTGSDGSAHLGLPDGSDIEIYPNSRVIYHANQFNLRDLLDIYLGKVRLQIQHLLPGEAPLRVTSPTAVISVRGTVFDVAVDAAQDTTVSVDTGVVSVRHRLLPGGEVMVEAGQSLHVAAGLPLTAAAKSVFPVRTIGRVVQAVAETLAQINAVRSSSGGSHGGSASSSGGGVSSSDSGSNQTKPPPGNDNKNPPNSGAPSSGSSAPPGDVLP
jgi:hypothetical protein